MVRMMLFVGCVLVAVSQLAAQDVALARGAPRFLASRGTAPAVEIDPAAAPVFQRRVTLALERATIGEALAAVGRQTGVRIVYSRDVLNPDRPARLKADGITVAAALTEILFGAGVDVVLSSVNRVTLAPRNARGAQPAGVIVGRVTDAKTAEGMSGVDVSLENTRWRATTDAEGRYRIADVSPGSYAVLARRIGYAPERRAVTVTAGQEATADVALQPAATRLGEVVVTAQKREERLQDVPLSVAVVTPEEIDRRGLVSAEDYLRGIPGVNQVSDGPSQQTIVIRGIETSPAFQNIGSGTTVATYFGETPTTNSAGLSGTTNVDVKLVDIERVEVLRGPQGTAFGNSSLGGAVRTIPVAPQLGRFEGKVGAGYSATAGTGGDNYNFQAVGNFPLLKDKLALRAVGYRYEDSGFYRNVAGSDPTFQSTVVNPTGAQAFATDEVNVGGSRFTGGRVAALFHASDALQVTLTYLKQKTEVDGLASANTGTYAHTALQVAPEHVVRDQRGAVSDTDIDLANATMDYDLGWANLLATYSYTEGGSMATGPVFQAWSLLIASEPRVHSGEIRLTTQLDGAWNFLGGLYAEKFDDEYYRTDYWFGSTESNLFFPGQRGLLSVYRSGEERTQKAAFAEASWEFLPDFTLTGGARAYDYGRTTVINSSGIFGDITDQAVTRGASGTSFRSNLSHKLSDNALLYAGWAQGFRLGKPTAGVPADLCDVNGDGILDGTTNVTIESTTRIDSDNVDNYELGGKFTLLDRRLIIAADIYRMDWTRLPVRLAAPGTLGSTDGSGCGFGYIANVGAARSEGIEFQANFYVTEAVRIDVGGSYVRARLTKDLPSINAFEGARLPGSPELNASLGLQYEFKIGGSTAFARVDPVYVGSFYGDVQESASTEAGGYVKVDASARVSLRNTNIDLFVRNLTNADDFTWRGAFGGGNEFSGYRMRPRTIGLQLSRNL